MFKFLGTVFVNPSEITIICIRSYIFGIFMQLIVQTLARRNSHTQNIGEKRKRCPRFRSQTFDPPCHSSDITNMRDNIFLRNFHITSLLLEGYTFAWIRSKNRFWCVDCWLQMIDVLARKVRWLDMFDGYVAYNAVDINFIYSVWYTAQNFVRARIWAL